MARTGVFIMALAALTARAAAQDSPCETSAPPAPAPVPVPVPVPVPAPPPPAPPPATVQHAHPFYGYGGLCVPGYDKACPDNYPPALPTAIPTTSSAATTSTAKPLHYFYIGRGFCADELGDVFDAWALNAGFTVNQCEEMCDQDVNCVGFDTTTHGLCILRFDQSKLPEEPNKLWPTGANVGREWKKWTKGRGEGLIHTVHPDSHFACYSKYPRYTTTQEPGTSLSTFVIGDTNGPSTPYPEGPAGGLSTLVPGGGVCKPVAPSECVFPFTYKGTEYESCTTVDKDNGKAWCSKDTTYAGHWVDCISDCAGKQNIGAIVGGTVGGAAALAGVGLIAGAAATNGFKGPSPSVPSFKAAPQPIYGGAVPQVQSISAPVAVGAVKLYTKEGVIEGPSAVSKYSSLLPVIAGLAAITLLASGVVYAVRRHVRQQSQVSSSPADLEQAAASDGDTDSGNAPLIQTSPAE